MRVKLSHNSRKLIKIYAGISTDLTSTTPEQTIEFPIFNFQGGDFPMQGEYSDPIEISLDVTKLLSYIEPNQEAKYFLLIDENDENSIGSGQIYDFSIYNVNTGTSAICTTHNTQILNNQTTKLSVNSTVNFDAPQIITSELPQFSTGNNYEKQMEANGGTPSYAWNFSLKYNEETVTGNFPNITSTQLSPSSDDDGVVSQSLDFSFPFYGKTYNQLIVSTDGSIIFSNDFSYLRNESAIINNKMIAVFAADLMYFPSDGIYYQGDANSATFRWKASLFENEDANIDVAVKIFPSGEIQYYYGSNITTGLVWASGISAGDGLNYSISSNSGIQNPSDNKYKFIAPAFPLGMNISKTGLFSGIPQTEGSWDINFLVTDFDNISKSKTLNFSGTTSGINCNEISKENISIYPNPVFNETCINFEITEQSMVEIEIFNTTGQSVKKLICNKLAKGNYNQKWDKTNYSGKIVESGTYFVRIKIDNKEYKKTLVCLKK